VCSVAMNVQASLAPRSVIGARLLDPRQGGVMILDIGPSTS